MGRLLTVQEVASILNVHPNTVYKWKDEGKIHFIKINGQIRFREDDILKWLEQRT